MFERVSPAHCSTSLHQVQKNRALKFGAKKQQAVPTLYRYLPGSRWSILGSQETMENKMRHLVDFMQDVLGVRRADEPTRVLAVSLTHVASNLTPTPDAAYEHVRLLSRIMVAKRGTTHGVETMQRLPDLPSDFMRLFPNAYKPDDHPVECRVSVGHILARCRPDTCPSRNPNSSAHWNHDDIRAHARLVVIKISSGVSRRWVASILAATAAARVVQPRPYCGMGSSPGDRTPPRSEGAR